MNFEEFRTRFLEWTESEIEAKKADGFAVCPYAKHARVNDKIQFIDARQDVADKLLTFEKDRYEIGICWVEGQDMEAIERLIEGLHAEHPDLLYFTSTPSSGHFAKNFTDCVFIQLRQDINEKRAALHNTAYYDSWPEEYYRIITGNH